MSRRFRRDRGDRHDRFGRPESREPDEVIDPDDEAYNRYLDGHRLHSGRGPLAPVEAAYRDAILGGEDRAWLHLGLLLAAQVGRRQDAKAALRAAMECDEPEYVAQAALRLGTFLDYEDGDPEAAAQLYEQARELGHGRIREDATVLLAYIGSTKGTRVQTAATLRSFIVRRFRGIDDSDDLIRQLADTFASMLHRPRLRRMLRGQRAARWRAGQARTERAMARRG